MDYSKKYDVLDAKLNRWEKETLNPHIRQFPETSDFVTVSGIPIQPVYTSADIKDMDYERDLGFPGEYPFTRGVIPNM
jgi:methylmalonyl-CoA mutase, N-terminal domain